MQRRKKWIAGAVAAGAVLAGGVGVAFGTSRGGAPNSPAEDRAETTFTEQRRSQAEVTEQQAIDAALARHPGTATDVHLEDEGHGLRWEVKPDDGSTLWEVQVDASTGKVVSDQPDE